MDKLSDFPSYAKATPVSRLAMQQKKKKQSFAGWKKSLLFDHKCSVSSILSAKTGHVQRFAA